MSDFRSVLRSSPADWNAEILADLRAVELEALCRLMAIPHSGTKAERCARLLDAADLRATLAPYKTPGQMTPFFSRRTLASLANRAGIWAGGTKWGLANGLLGWRNACRTKGQRFRAEMQAAYRELPHQERLF